MVEKYIQGWQNIMKYFINHNILATFREHLKLKLLKVTNIKFASHYTLLRCLPNCREQLVSTICFSKWNDLVKNADAAIRAKVVDTIKKNKF